MAQLGRYFSIKLGRHCQNMIACLSLYNTGPSLERLLLSIPLSDSQRIIYLLVT